jgi:hypothetical protein
MASQSKRKPNKQKQKQRRHGNESHRPLHFDNTRKQTQSGFSKEISEPKCRNTLICSVYKQKQRYKLRNGIFFFFFFFQVPKTKKTNPLTPNVCGLNRGKKNGNGGMIYQLKFLINPPRCSGRERLAEKVGSRSRGAEGSIYILRGRREGQLGRYQSAQRTAKER